MSPPWTKVPRPESTFLFSAVVLFSISKRGIYQHLFLWHKYRYCGSASWNRTTHKGQTVPICCEQVMLWVWTVILHRVWITSECLLSFLEKWSKSDEGGWWFAVRCAVPEWRCQRSMTPKTQASKVSKKAMPRKTQMHTLRELEGENTLRFSFAVAVLIPFSASVNKDLLCLFLHHTSLG